MAKLAAGAVIGGSLTNGLLYSQGVGLTANAGSIYRWNDGNTGYFGFKFKNSAGEIRFGWAELALNAGSRAEGVITQIVYDDTGAAVTTGVVPAPGALALLGVAGVLGSRRRR